MPAIIIEHRLFISDAHKFLRASKIINKPHSAYTEHKWHQKLKRWGDATIKLFIYHLFKHITRQKSLTNSAHIK